MRPVLMPRCWFGVVAGVLVLGFARTADSKQTCIKAVTGEGQYDRGYITVTVDEGKGAGYQSVSQGKFYGKGSIAVDRCYDQIKGVQVRGPNKVRWAGSLTFSVDGGLTYTAGTCVNCQVKPGCSTGKMLVEADRNSNQNVRLPMLLDVPLLRFYPLGLFHCPTIAFKATKRWGESSILLQQIENFPYLCGWHACIKRRLCRCTWHRL